jgi:CHASE2 domain
MFQVIKPICEWLFYEGKEPFHKRYSDGAKNPLFLVFVIGGICLTLWLSHRKFFEYAALQADDDLVTRAAAKHPQVANDLRIVYINPSDFEKYFDGRTPYPIDPFYRMVCTLMRTRPAVLVVDLDTSHADFRRMPLLPSNGVPLVWARAAREDEHHRLVPEHVLGGRELSKGQLSGLTAVSPVLDWSIRSYPRRVDTIARNDNPSIHWAAVEAYCQRFKCSGFSDEISRSDRDGPAFDRYFTFARFSINEFNPTSCPVADKPDGRLTDEIVIFGGSYSSADMHRTVFGDLTGAEVVALAIEHELNPSGSRLMTTGEEILLKLILAFCVLGIHTVFKPMPAMFVTVLILSLLIWQGVWLAYSVFGYRASVVPFLTGILIEQLTTSAKGTEHPSIPRGDWKGDTT